MWRPPLLVLMIFATYFAMTLALAEPATEVGYPPVDFTGVRGPASPSSVVVVPGDHLWKIAKTHMTSTNGNPPADSDVTPYWRAVISYNEGGLRSGDPDLIYPGEVVQLPSVVTGQQ